MNDITVQRKQTAEINPLSLLQSAIEKGIEPDKLDRLYDLQERYEKSQSQKAFNHAMSEFAKNAPKLVKDKNVSFKQTQYKYVTLASVVNAVQKVMSKLGLSHRWKTTQDNNQITVECIVTHEQGYSESSSFTAPPDISGAKNSIQAIGSTISYGQRYTLLSILGLSAFEDDDAKKACKEKDLYSPERFDKNFPEWIEQVKSRKRQALAIITFLTDKFDLSDDQKIKLLELKQVEFNNAK